MKYEVKFTSQFKKDLKLSKKTRERYGRIIFCYRKTCEWY